MYNAHWIHSLPYSKFIELTLVYVFSAKLAKTKSVYQSAIPNFCEKFGL